jgi:hypothetical protein
MSLEKTSVRHEVSRHEKTMAVLGAFTTEKSLTPRGIFETMPPEVSRAIISGQQGQGRSQETFLRRFEECGWLERDPDDSRRLCLSDQGENVHQTMLAIDEADTKS